MGITITIQRPDGKDLFAYLAEPQESSPGNPSVVVLQEWWGVNDQIKGVADRLSHSGFRGLVPDLYGGELATTVDEAQQLMSQMDWGEAVSQNIRASVEHLKSSGSEKTAILGFCMGGALTTLAAANLPLLDAAVSFYGIPPTEELNFSQVNFPLLAHFATQDDWCNAELIDKLKNRLHEGNTLYEFYLYEAQHAFFNEKRTDVYNANSADLAWQRTLTYLNKNLS